MDMNFYVILWKTQWEEFVEHIKQEYYLEDTYEQKYMQWKLL